ncbi:cobalt/nickel transport system permease protein [Desulfohalotomaculum tongense]|uniref:energy-coupling factor ABC transporter permease n=1 Tax=Desulforadius tongensis TaxID=1216062 RepID=UPI00195BE90E|nr:energy-coupling factor ABC transporter permease [Desulforadius tongensis]MBM7856001.1 cobalt/nickel transport system permease protein [Desulforadius tongensis]
MHIPNGFLDPVTASTTAALSSGTLVYGWNRLRREISQQPPTTLGLVAAFIFAAQMINYAIGHHTSGHMIGAMVAVVVCGPWAAGLVMAAVISIQSLFFHDGGTIALGANILNMAVIATAVSYTVYRTAAKKTNNRQLAMAAGAWLSVVIASAAAAIELAVSGTAPLAAVLPAMLKWHSLIGIGEAGITLFSAHYLIKYTKQKEMQMQVNGYVQK